MLKTLEKCLRKSFDDPEEVRTFEKGRVELVSLGGAVIGRATFEPGWRWSTCVKPLAKTESCQSAHAAYHLSGTLRVRMDDGSEFSCKPGDVVSIPAGHDAWVEGGEKVVAIDFHGMEDYAKKK